MIKPKPTSEDDLRRISEAAEQHAERVLKQKDELRQRDDESYRWAQKQIAKHVFSDLPKLARAAAHHGHNFLDLAAVAPGDLLAEAYPPGAPDCLSPTALKPGSAPVVLRSHCLNAGFKAEFERRAIHEQPEYWLCIRWSESDVSALTLQQNIAELMNGLPMPTCDLPHLRQISEANDDSQVTCDLSSLKDEVEDVYNAHMLDIARQIQIASAVLESVPQLVKEAAEHGKMSIPIYRFGQESYVIPDGVQLLDVLDPRYLRKQTAAQLIYDRCRAAHLRPLLRFWTSEEGLEHGYEIVVRW